MLLICPNQEHESFLFILGIVLCASLRLDYGRERKRLGSFTAEVFFFL